MTQPDMFEMYSIERPLQVAQRKRDRGIARSEGHAGREWQDKAVGYVRLHALVNREFLTEGVRAMAEADGLSKPPDKRAWGAVMKRAQREGIVRAYGYAPAKSSNLSPKVNWASCLRTTL